jgi:class 3 adenylate cyclase
MSENEGIISGNFLEKIIWDNIAEAVLICDLELKALYLNAKFKKNISNELQIGESIIEYLPPEFNIKSQPYQESGEFFSHILIKKSLELFVRYYVVNDVQFSDSKYIIFLIKDITYLKRLEDGIKIYTNRFVQDHIFNNEISLVRFKSDLTSCAVLFCDIRGFTQLSEELDHDAIFDSLNNFFSPMVNIVEKNEGFIDKIVGDQLMAIFIGKEAKIIKSNSINCAIEMRKLLHEMNKTLNYFQTSNIKMGIGINFGVVMKCNLGSFKRKDYSILGDTVNVASRLCQMAKSDQILLTESTLLKNHKKQFKFIGNKSIRGKSNSICIYEI